MLGEYLINYEIVKKKNLSKIEAKGNQIVNIKEEIDMEILLYQLEKEIIYTNSDLDFIDEFFVIFTGLYKA